MHAILLPGRIPGVKNYDKVQLLPSSTTNIDVYREYEKAIQATGERVCGKSSFFKYWEMYVPTIRTMKAMSDLCCVCQKNSSALARSVSMADERESGVSHVHVPLTIHTSLDRHYVYSETIYHLQKGRDSSTRPL